MTVGRKKEFKIKMGHYKCQTSSHFLEGVSLPRFSNETFNMWAMNNSPDKNTQRVHTLFLSSIKYSLRPLSIYDLPTDSPILKLRMENLMNMHGPILSPLCGALRV